MSESVNLDESELILPWYPRRNERMMGALYEDVEKFFGDIFAYYGRLVARFPVFFILVPVLACSLLGLGLVNFRHEYDVENLYTPIESEAGRDREVIDFIFKNSTDENFYRHQDVFLPPFAVIIVTPKPSHEGYDDYDDVIVRSPLTPQILTEIVGLMDFLKHRMTIVYQNVTYTFKDVCALRDKKCIIEGEEIVKELVSECGIALPANMTMSLQPLHSSEYYNKPNLNIYTKSNSNPTSNDNTTTTTTSTSTTNRCAFPQSIKVHFDLAHDSPRDREMGLLWERRFLVEMEKFSLQLKHSRVVYTVSESLDILLFLHAGQDIKLFAATCVIMVCYVTLLGSGGNWVSTHILLAQMSVVGTFMSIVAAFGTMMIAGIPYVGLCSVMPFMVMGMGIDHMYLLISAWRRTDIRASVEDRISEAYRACSISIIIMSLTDLLVFCIGSTSVFLSVRYFCAASGIALLYCYINQLTFFGGCLVLNARRIAASRHCITCLTTTSRQEMEEEKKPRYQIMLCSGSPPRRASDIDSVCRRCPRSLLRKDCLRGFTKLFVFVLYVGYLALSFIGVQRMEVGFRSRDVVPSDSHLEEFQETELEYYNNDGPVVMFVLDKPLQYERLDLQQRIRRMLQGALVSPHIDRTRHILWLDDYVPYLQLKTNSNQASDVEFMQYLDDFLAEYPQYMGDIVIDRSQNVINCTRFYVFAKHVENSTAQRQLMLGMRQVAHNTSLPLIVYSKDFVFYEHHVSILKTTNLTVTVTIISMLLIALMFIPHPVAVTCVIVSMVSVVLGMMGFLYYTGLSLSAIQTVQILIGVGLCLNFTVHISHSFMAATGKSRNERVSAALEKVGGLIFNGAVSFFLGITMLAFGSSYLYTSFFKSMAVVILVGLLHAMVLLPVLLSFLGPRRTCKPRIYAQSPRRGQSVQDSNLANPKDKLRQQHGDTPEEGLGSPDCQSTIDESQEPICEPPTVTTPLNIDKDDEKYSSL